MITPLFGVRVPVKAHTLADPEKGTGAAMICTFGDITDVIWWRELQLPVRAIIQANGAFKPVTWGDAGWESVDAVRAQQHYDQLAGLSAAKARAKVVEMLRESGDLLGDPRPITHAVKFYEKGDRPLEIITSRQWFIRTMEFRDRLLARGAELKWHPAVHAGTARELDQRPERRLVHQPPALLRRAVPGLVQGPARMARVDHDARLLPDEARLPIDPSTDVPDGYAAEQRDQPGGFTGDKDVMDTWATSSLSPQIAGRWDEDDDLFVADLPDGPAAAGARHHPDLAVLDRCCAQNSSTAHCRGGTRRSPAGCSIRIARRCRSRRGTSSRRWGCSRSTAPTACATGRRAAGPAPTPRSTPAR